MRAATSGALLTWLVGMLVPLLAACASAVSPRDQRLAGHDANLAQGSMQDDSSPAERQMTNAIFLHHSVGSGLIAEGQLRSLMTARGFQLYDQGYNEHGLTLPSGEPSGYGYRVPDDNTDPDGLAAIFAQTVDPESVAGIGEPSNTISGLLRHDVIIFKSCFPASGIVSDAHLETYKGYYRSIRSFANDHPDHVFIALSPPPLEPGSTNRAEAARARTFANWLKSPEFAAPDTNVFVFDLFDVLAEVDRQRADVNMLRASYRLANESYRPKAVIKRLANFGFESFGSSRYLGDGDSHPNARANAIVAPILARAVESAVRTRSDTRQTAASASHR